MTYVTSDKQDWDKEFRLTSTSLCISIIFLAVAIVSVGFFVGTTPQVRRMTDDNHSRVSACYALLCTGFCTHAYQDCEELKIRIETARLDISHPWAQPGFFFSEGRQPGKMCLSSV